MKRIYNTGLDNSQIFLEVLVGTPGEVHTVANQFRQGGQRVTLAESNANNGNIQNILIGTAQSLRNSYLIIRSLVDFGALDPAQWLQLSQNVQIRYHLSGGFSGDQFYNPDIDDITFSQNQKIVVVSKPIELI